jgi:MscS family membrane protein
VEDVGIRSTRIRTNDRTVVTIPNGDFSSRQIENFAKRDRFLFNPVIGIEYNNSADKVREAVAIIENILVGHEKVLQDGPRARFTNFGENSLDIEVFSYIDVSDFEESTVVRQELLLSIYEQLSAAGIGIAFPTRTVFLAPPPTAPTAAPAGDTE